MLEITITRLLGWRVEEYDGETHALQSCPPTRFTAWRMIDTDGVERGRWAMDEPSAWALSPHWMSNSASRDELERVIAERWGEITVCLSYAGGATATIRQDRGTETTTAQGFGDSKGKAVCRAFLNMIEKTKGDEAK